MCVTKRVSAKMRLQIKQTTYSILARVMFITFAYVYRLNLGYFSGTLEKSAPGEIIPKLVGPCYVYHSLIISSGKLKTTCSIFCDQRIRCLQSVAQGYSI